MYNINLWIRFFFIFRKTPRVDTPHANRRKSTTAITNSPHPSKFTKKTRKSNIGFISINENINDVTFNQTIDQKNEESISELKIQLQKLLLDNESVGKVVQTEILYKAILHYAKKRHLQNSWIVLFYQRLDSV